MGYCIDKTWDLHLVPDVSITDLATALRGLGLSEYISGPDDDRDELLDDAPLVLNVLGQVSEHNELGAYVGGGVIDGSTYGKTYEEAENAIFPVLARFVTGTIDLVTEDSSHYRLRFHGDGRITEHAGDIVYPSDEVGS